MTIKPRIGMVSETKLKLVSVWLTAGVSRMFWTKYSSTINDNGFETKRVGPVCVMLSQTFLYVFYARNISQRQRVGGLKTAMGNPTPSPQIQRNNRNHCSASECPSMLPYLDIKTAADPSACCAAHLSRPDFIFTA